MDNSIEWPFVGYQFYSWHEDFPDYRNRMRWIAGNARWYYSQL